MVTLFRVLIALVLSSASASVLGQPDAPEPEQLLVQGGTMRLHTLVFKSTDLSKRPVLVVVIHGDAPFNKPDYHYAFAARVAATHRDVIAVGLLRPGYTDPKGNASDGERGNATGDNWNAGNTDAIAAAIGNLAERWNTRKTVVSGHSGGAALTANMLGLHPDLIDAALLVSLPGDVAAWRRHMLGQTGAPVFRGQIETLSAIDQLPGVGDGVSIRLVVGSEDDVTPPGLSERYRSRAVALGKQVTLVTLEGKGHEIFLEPAVFTELALLLPR